MRLGCGVQSGRQNPSGGSGLERRLASVDAVPPFAPLTMAGRIRRRLLADRLDALPADSGPLLCPLCQRPIPPSQKDAHHLVPRSHGGRHTEYLHRICHRQIHALFTETELARRYATVEALLAHPEVARFVAWVQGKPPDFMERTRKSQRLRQGRALGPAA